MTAVISRSRKIVKMHCPGREGQDCTHTLMFTKKIVCLASIYGRSQSPHFPERECQRKARIKKIFFAYLLTGQRNFASFAVCHSSSSHIIAETAEALCLVSSVRYAEGMHVSGYFSATYESRKRYAFCFMHPIPFRITGNESSKKGGFFLARIVMPKSFLFCKETWRCG